MAPILVRCFGAFCFLAKPSSRPSQRSSQPAGQPNDRAADRAAPQAAPGGREQQQVASRANLFARSASRPLIVSLGAAEITFPAARAAHLAASSLEEATASATGSCLPVVVIVLASELSFASVSAARPPDASPFAWPRAERAARLRNLLPASLSLSDGRYRPASGIPLPVDYHLGSNFVSSMGLCCRL